MKSILTFLGCLWLVLPATYLSAGELTNTIRLDAASPGRVFEGIGAVSAGASTRLLIDYPEPQRAQILDLLFKPQFGAGFQHLKVEIGSGENSTCGSEPSHAISADELAEPKPRGYEFWLMAEARKRNPGVILDCLPWAYPHWVGDRFSRNSADWFAAFLQTARKHYGLELDWVAAAQNEMGTDLNWVRKDLRPALDAQGFGKVKLHAPDDNGKHWQIFDALEKDAELDRLLGAASYHYLDGRDPWKIDQKRGHPATEKAKRSGKPLWASEEWSQSGKEWGGKGALYLARLMNKLYTRDRATKFELWCPIDSIYDQIIWADTGAMQADTPWCGAYTVWPAVWAIAHTTQFAQPGWVYMDDACGQLDTNTWRGSHVALRAPRTGDWSVIVVTGEKRTIQLTAAPGLKRGPVYVWKSTEAAQFIQQPSLSWQDNKVELALDPDAIYTLTSTTGQQKGSFGVPPPRKPFPLPFKDDFESYRPGDTAHYFSDQKGTFEVCRRPDGGQCLAQIVPAQGILWIGNWLLKPHTLFGDTDWQDCVIEADVFLAGGDVELGGRYAHREKLGYRWILTRDGRWQLNWQFTTLAAGQVVNFNPAAWHHLRLEMKGDQLMGLIDGKKLATVKDASGAKGMAFLASTYDRNLFDNVRVGPIQAEDARTLLEKGRGAGALPEGIVIRISACLGEADTKASGERVPAELHETWEFTSNQVHRVVLESEEQKLVYRRVESHPFDSKGLCEALLDGKAIEIQARKGKGQAVELVGTIYRRGSRSIEVLWNGETLLDLHESNGAVLDRYRESDARAFGALYEKLATQARRLFQSKADETK